MNTIPTNSIINGNQIQTDAVTTSLTVACDPHLLVPNYQMEYQILSLIRKRMGSLRLL